MTTDDWLHLMGSSSRIRERAAMNRIAHHYFYTGTMSDHPLFHFDPERNPGNHAKLMAVVEAEQAAGRFDDWAAGIGTPAKPYPEPFPHLVDKMFHDAAPFRIARALTPVREP